ncbi:MAG: dihydroneopterin aldolase [Acidobacteriota bacterium]|nr:dihydroneopterin aldolase [Acidobacteriota bacterium]
MDKILLRDIRLQMKVGTTREERGRAQPCRADLTLWRSLEKARDGRLDQTVDYSAVYAQVEKLCESRTFTLLEEAALQICREVLKDFPVRKVRVRIGKTSPFSEKLGFVGVQVERRRSWLS